PKETLRRTMLRLIFITSCWLSVRGKQVDVTIDDTDPSIIYLPTASWQASSNSNDLGSTLMLHKADTDGDGKNGEDVDGDGAKEAGSKRLDADDSGFVDTPVTAQFSFNGTAASLFAIEPLATNAMNLTFNLDNDTSYPAFTHNKSQTTQDSIQNLNDGPHTLLVTVGPGSVFLFDYMRHNIATFGGAVGGSVGVLSSLRWANHLQAPLLSSLSRTSFDGFAWGRSSYADIPPPMQLDDGIESEPPSTSHEEETVGTTNDGPVMLPEAVVLPPSRGRSRASSHSSVARDLS
ncbi:hypothetical protein BDQ17DRAFT_1351548, partial [Cyathus striatus]